MSPDVAAFLLNLLVQQNLAIGAPDFADLAALIARAKAELEAIAAGDDA